MLKLYTENLQKVVKSYLSKAEKDIKISVCWFTDKDIFNLLVGKCKSGVAVALVINYDSTNINRLKGLDFDRFIQAGGLFYRYQSTELMHRKSCTIDDRYFLSGSYNWTYTNNCEHLMVASFQGDAPFFQEVKKSWAELLKKCILLSKIDFCFEKQEMELRNLMQRFRQPGDTKMWIIGRNRKLPNWSEEFLYNSLTMPLRIRNKIKEHDVVVACVGESCFALGVVAIETTHLFPKYRTWKVDWKLDFSDNPVYVGDVFLKKGLIKESKERLRLLASIQEQNY
jgi:hypothetical protein